MSENRDEEPRKGSTAPGLEGEGDASIEEGVRERLTDGQVNTTAEERGPLHGDPDAER